MHELTVSVLFLAAVASGQASAPTPRTITTPDGSRFLLVPTGGTPVIHWVIATPAGPIEDPAGLEGLARAVARAALAGPLSIGSRDPVREKGALERLDQLEVEQARLLFTGADPGGSAAATLEARAQLEAARGEAKVLADPGSFELDLRMAPSLETELVETREQSLLHLTIAPEGLAKVATLLVLSRENPALRGIWDHFRNVRAEMAREHGKNPRAAAHEEVVAQHYLELGHPYARAFAPSKRTAQPLARSQAMSTFQQTHAPARVVHVLCGGFAPDLVEPVLKRAFGATTIKPLPRPLVPPVADNPTLRRSTLSQTQEGALVLAWRSPSRLRADAVDGLVEWLCGGPESLLARHLKKVGIQGVRVTGEAGFPGRIANGLILLEAIADPDVDGSRIEPVAVLGALEEAMAAAAKDGPTREELQRVAVALAAKRTLFANPRDLALGLAARVGLTGESLEQTLALRQPGADELRSGAAMLGEKNRPVTVIMEPK
jgi:predicted Zn-dependent peptidase